MENISIGAISPKLQFSFVLRPPPVIMHSPVVLRIESELRATGSVTYYYHITTCVSCDKKEVLHIHHHLLVFVNFQSGVGSSSGDLHVSLKNAGETTIIQHATTAGEKSCCAATTTSCTID